MESVCSELKLAYSGELRIKRTEPVHLNKEHLGVVVVVVVNAICH